MRRSAAPSMSSIDIAEQGVCSGAPAGDRLARSGQIWFYPAARGWAQARKTAQIVNIICSGVQFGPQVFQACHGN